MRYAKYGAAVHLIPILLLPNIAFSLELVPGST